MILVHAFLLLGPLLLAISAQEVAQTTRLNEARARAVANRARIRANVQRIRERLHHPSTRTKRQHISDNFDGQSEDLGQLVCTLSQDEERSSNPHEQISRSSENEHDLHFPRVHGEARSTGDILHSGMLNIPTSPVDEARRLIDEEEEIEESLDQALDQLTEAREKLHRLDEENFRQAQAQSLSNSFPRAQNQFFSQQGGRGQSLSNNFPRPQNQLFSQQGGRGQSFSSNFPRPQNQFVNQQGGGTNSAIFRGLPRTDGNHPRGADADALIPFHSHIQGHGLNSFVPSTQFAVPGFNFHLNPHQPLVHNTPLVNQGIVPTHAQGIIPPHAQGILPTHTQGILPTHSQVFPHQSIFPTQTLPLQPLTHLRSQVVAPHPEKVGTVKESDEARESIFDPFNQADEVMDFLARHEDREADPTIHKLKQLKMQKLQPHYPVYQNPGHYGYGNLYREADDEENAREADPTIHKLKKLKMLKEQKFQPYSYPVYSYTDLYREAEEAGDSEIDEEERREADPTIHKLKKLKQQKFQPTYYQPSYVKGPAYSNPSHYGYGSLYREAEAEENAREADPTIHKLKKLKQQKLQSYSYPVYPQPQYYQPSYVNRYKEANPDVSAPSLFDFPPHTSNFYQYNKRSIDQNESRMNRSRRSIPLMRLISDPNVRLDVPRTIENFGTATKSAFEDERAPMYHFKHLVGSSKNALLSAMRIPPQNMIIPSDYEIVKSEEKIRPAKTAEDDDPMGFSRTFKRVGQMVRESVKSGQETASHLGDVSHSARNILNSARHSAPRLIIPYSQIPAIQDPRRRSPSKAILITPRILDLAHERLGMKKSSDYNSNLVKLGHLMDAVGLSQPNSKKLDLQKIIFEPRRPHQAKVDGRLAQLYSRFRENFDHDSNTVGEAISTLEDAKISVGAKNLRDFLVKMRNELTSMVRTTPHKKTTKKKKQKEAKEMGVFIENLFDGKNEIEEKNETVGLDLPAELLHPFMGRATDEQMKNFFSSSPSDHYHDDLGQGQRNNSDLGYVLGAINPLMLERMYNQTVRVSKQEHPKDMFDGRLQETSPEGDKVGTVMTLNGPMLKPFMGQAQPQAVEEFLDTYNDERGEDFEEDD